MNKEKINNENLIFLGHSEFLFDKKMIDGQPTVVLNIEDKDTFLYFYDKKNKKIVNKKVISRPDDLPFLTKFTLNNEKFYMGRDLSIGGEKNHKYSFNYISIFEHVDNDFSYLILEREECDIDKKKLSLGEELTINDIQKTTFYDVLFIKNDSFYLIVNDKKDTILTKNDIDYYVKNKKQQIAKTKLFADYYAYYNLFVPYVFDYDEIFFLNDKKSIKSLQHKLKNSNDSEKQFLKFKNLGSFENRILKTELYNIPNYIYNSIDYLDLDVLFNTSKIFKKYVLKTLNIPQSLQKINDLDEFMMYYTYPVFENLWQSFIYEDMMFSYDMYYLITKKSYAEKRANYTRENDSLHNFYKNVSFKELQKMIPLFSKKVNQLMKEKIIFANNEEITEYKQQNKDVIYTFSSTFFHLFKNVDNLQKFVERHPEIVINKKLDELNNDLYLYMPLYYLNEKDYYEYNVLNLLEEKGTKSEVLKKIKKKVKKMSYEDKMEQDYYKIISGVEINDLLSEVFKSSDNFERIITNYFYSEYEKSVKNDESLNEFYSRVHNHFGDVFTSFYKLDYIYKNGKYKKYMEPIYEDFYAKKYHTFDEFESNVYILNGYFEKDRLQQLIPSKQFSYIENKDFYFSQPKDGFELKRVGDMMHHCVFTYFNDVKKETTNQFIVVLYKKENNEPLVCLEIREQIKNSIKRLELIQAKCKYNKVAKKEPIYQQYVIDFCNKNGIYYNNCSDI